VTDHNDAAKEGRQIPWKPVSIAGIITLMVAIVPIHDRVYDSRYVRTDRDSFEKVHKEFALKDQVLTVSEAMPIKEQVAKIDRNSSQNTEKLDTLLISSAIQLAISAEDRYERLSNTPTASEQDVHDAKATMIKAQRYRDCLLDRQPNCQALRVW